VVAQNVAFWILAIAMAGAAIGVVRSQNVVHAALYLVVVLAGAAAQYILLAAEFVAWVQVLIYIGAIVILFLFGIMLTRAPMRPEGSMDNSQRVAAGVVSLFLFGVITALLVDAYHGKEIELSDDLVLIGSSDRIASDMFRNYLVPFEVVSMLLLAALVGAVVIARRD
jgi:NADH-quinone oxidoreductase subunit J